MGCIIAIDPGVTGALVALDLPTGKVWSHIITPTIKVGSKSRVNGAAIAAWLQEQPAIEHAYIEQVHAMPGGGERKMGASSAFTFGHASGFVEGVITGAGIPVTLVPPGTWKKYSGLTGKEKDAARSRAVQLYPDLRVLDTKGKGQAVADAIHIGLYGRHQLAGQLPLH